VASVANLRARDVDVALAVVMEAAAADGPQPFGVDVIRELLRLVPADRAGYFEYGIIDPQCRDPGLWQGNRPPRYSAEEPTYDFGWHDAAIPAALGTWPLHDMRSRRATTATKLSDLLTGTRLRCNAWYATVMRPRSIEHEIKLWLPGPPNRIRGFFFVRGSRDRDFDERERALLDLLGPHLASVRERWERRSCPARLTGREADVMKLVAEGLTNREVARRLVISNATVRTHLENIFEKFGVHTRTAAVARAFGSPTREPTHL
jgi:DNA-binding CsgD family transcriptional regulator